MKIKRFAAGMCALALCFGMTACGSSESGNNSSTGGNTESKAETTTTTAAESKNEITMKETAKKTPCILQGSFTTTIYIL